MSEYPGHGEACNRCGLCCKTVPCEMSQKRGLWRNGACIALKKNGDTYDCDAITNAWRYPVSGLQLERRLEMIGISESEHGCTFRAAFNQEQADHLLAKPNPLRPDGSCTVFYFAVDGIKRLERPNA